MKLHYLQHVPFEDMANITKWAKNKNFEITCTKLYNNEKLPITDDLDWLIIMGGPMNVYDEDTYPWLKREKEFIKKAIDNGKTVIGICLGAQLIADVLGGLVYQNAYKEIGWYDVKLTEIAKDIKLFANFPSNFIAFHWHGDTFDLPDTCKHVAYSDACENQAFIYDERVIGLQFHFESNEESIRKLINNCGNELSCKKYIQSEKEIISKLGNINKMEKLMEKFLNNLINR